MNEQQPLSLERLAEIRSRSERLATVCQATGTPRTTDEYERDCLLAEVDRLRAEVEQLRAAPRLITAAEIQLGDVVADSVGGTWTRWTAVTTADGLRLATGHQVLPAEYVEENYGPLLLIERRGVQ